MAVFEIDGRSLIIEGRRLGGEPHSDRKWSDSDHLTGRCVDEIRIDHVVLRSPREVKSFVEWVAHRTGHHFPESTYEESSIENRSKKLTGNVRDNSSRLTRLRAMSDANIIGREQNIA